MITVGVTGGIGSGKSTVCKEWEKLGAKVVYADDLAKDLMVSDVTLRKKLKKVFGEETYHPDGSLNRQHLIRHAFEKGRVEELNQLVHPAVTRKFKEISKQAEKSGEKVVVEEAALLLNNGRPSHLDVVVLVKSEREKRIQRVVARDKVPAEKVLDRDKNQPDFGKLTHLVDYTIENNGTLEELKEKSKKMFNMLVEKAEK
ncbi:MAG: dephospho-CoA kinase [Balneolaceae bacterium]|nr:dephospho-CoA kinase [Balneolaceae bacterium]